MQLDARPVDVLNMAAVPRQFLRNTWYVATWSADVSPGTLLPRTILGEPIVFFRNAEGAVAALQDECPHRFAPLSLGSLVDDGSLKCGYHGLQFSASGICLYNPHGDHRVPAAAKVRAYPVVEKHSIVWVWMGDEAPDANAIPDYSVFDTANPAYVSKRDYLLMSANYEIITNNLIDLSHVSFLHDGLLGNAESAIADVEVSSDDKSVTQKRFSRDIPVPSVFDMMFRNDGKAVDQWTDMRWYVPACMLLDTGVCEPGAERSSGSGLFGIHLLTPETEMTTHYHFAAVRQNPPIRPEAEEIEIREKLSIARRFAFEKQDAPMIEAQQKRLVANGAVEKRPVLLGIDAGPVRAQRMLHALIAKERAASAEAQGKATLS